jgi:hypothetical protein
MNDEQRSLSGFGAQAGGTGPLFRPTVLLLAYVASVHRACGALLAEKLATVAANRLV